MRRGGLTRRWSRRSGRDSSSSLHVPIEQFSFRYRLRVRWAEVDLQQVVFNGHYLTYFDVGFTEFWRATGLPGPIDQAQTGFELFARKATVEYHAPARYDDVLDIYVRPARLGTTSMTVALEIHRAAHPDAPATDELLISGELVYVYTDVKARRPVALPADWRAVLESGRLKESRP